MSLVLTVHGTGTQPTVTVNVKEISVTSEAENEVIPIPNENHEFIFLGNKGDTIELTFDLFSSTNLAIVQAFNGNTLLDATTSTYEEITPSTHWAVVSRNISRKGGYLSRWTVKLKLTQAFAGKTTLSDGTTLT